MRHLTLLVFVATLVGCAQKDTDAPPAPNVDPVTSPTVEPTQRITGSAEYGALVRVTGGAAPVEVTADPFTARFRVEVPLKPSASNVLAFTATDSDGNVSEPSTVTIDTLEAAVVIEDLRRNGVPCDLSGSPAACVVAPDDFLEFTVSATDDRALSELSYTAFFATAGASGTLRARTVLVPVDAALPVSQPFSFNVPGAAFLEDVTLTAMAVDSEGNRSTSRQVLLRLNLQTFKARQASLVLRDLQGGQVQGPEDVAVAADGTVLVANTGAGEILALAPGSQFPTVRASSAALAAATGGAWDPSFLTLDSAGNLYATEAGQDWSVVRIAPGGGAVEYLRYGFQTNLRGLAMLPPSVAKALVNVVATTDAVIATVGGVEYELDGGGGCSSARICVPVGTSVDTLAANLAACIASGSGCTTGSPASAAAPHPSIAAAVSSTSNAVVVLAARDPGAAGNALALATSDCAVVRFNGAACSANLAHGAGATLLAAQESNGPVTDTVYRFALDLTGLPRNEGAAVASYDLSSAGPVGHEQWGLAARSLATATSTARQDLVLYFPDETTGGNRLRAARIIDQAAPATVFNTAAVSGGRAACSDCIRGTNDPDTPSATFSRLWDVELMADGCLVVSDPGRGNLYSVDTRDASAADPKVSLVATGLPGPRGLAHTAAGELLVALRDADAVIRIGPSADPEDCF